MISCHLLLGKPWNQEQGAVYFMDNNYKYSKYDVIYGEKLYTLLSMDTRLYKPWREERLQKKKDQEKAKKNEVDTVVLYHGPVQSIDDIAALKTDSKPRTVSFEEGEDDVVPANILPNYFQVKENNQRQISTLESKTKLAGHAYEPVQCMDVGLLLVDQWEKEIGSPTYIRNNKASQFEKEGDQRRHENKDWYFFSRSRPPKVVDGLPREDRPSSLFSLKDTGWGPPTCLAIYIFSSLVGCVFSFRSS
jgi:hypothetical protein